MNAEEYRNKGIDYAKSFEYSKALDCLEKSIEMGNVDAINDAGVVVQKLGCFKKAYEFYLEASKKGSPTGYVNLGNVYRKGIYVKKDLKKSIEYYMKAIDLGSTLPYYDLYEIYTEELASEPNSKEIAIKYLKKGACEELKTTKDCYGCIMQLNYNLVTGLYIDKDEKKAFSLIKRAAKKNQGPIFYNLACHYISAQGTPKKINLGLKYLEKACEKGYPNAFYYSAILYKEGKDVKRDMQKVYYYLQKGWDLSSLKCVILYADLCFNPRYRSEEFNQEKGRVSVLCYNHYILNNSNIDFSKEKKLYEKLKNKYAGKVDFDYLEELSKKDYEKSLKPNLVA